MKKRIIGIITCIMIMLPCVSINAVGDPGPDLFIEIYGGNYMFIVLGLMGLDMVGGAIGNRGDSTAENVSYNFTVTGGFLNNIDYNFADYWGNIKVNEALGVATYFVSGFGPVTITLSATSSNADDVSETVKGFQLGSITWVPILLKK